MHPYVLIPAAASIVSAACAGGLLARPTGRPGRRLAAILLLGASYWALCEVGWNLAGDADTALWLMRLSAPGWLFIGPLVLHIFLSQDGRVDRAGDRGVWPRRLLALLYASSFAFLVLVWATPWVLGEPVRTGWGWSYTGGPVYALFYACTMAGVLTSVATMRRLIAAGSSPGERQQRPFQVVAVAAPMLVASLTDVVLPLAGVHPPRLGSASFALLGAIALSSVLHWGYSLLNPGTFADGILATLPDGVALLHADERIRVANAGLVRLSGRSREELEGVPLGELFTFSFGDLGAGSDEVDCELTHASGEPIPVTLSSSVLHDRQGQPMGRVLIVRDLREVADLRSRLLMSARLAAVGELAAGVAHEINNPIAFVRANLSQLASHWKALRGDFDPARASDGTREMLLEGDELIEESLEGIARAAEIVRGVKGFAHRGSGERERADLNQLLEDVLHMASAELRGRARLERVYAEIPPVDCVPQELKQVFLNLIVNASQAIGDDGLIRIATRAIGDDVMVAISDDGCGIPTAIIDRIFDPFFTTKGVGEGTGLGLGIAYQIVRSHRGEIRVDSEPGRGTTFTVRLPV